MLYEPPIEFYKFGMELRLRDAKRRSLLKIDINGLDYVQMKKAEDLLNHIVYLLNNESIPMVKEVEPVAVASHSNGNNVLLNDNPKKARNPWGRAGKPR